MLNRFTLKGQLTLSFSSLLILLSIVVVLSVYGLLKSQDSFEEYTELATDTNLAGNLQSNMLLTRLHATAYINQDTPETLALYQERLDNTLRLLDEASQQITSPKRSAKIAEANNLINDYLESFDQVVSLIAQRHELIDGQFIPTGRAMRVALTDLIDYSYAKGDFVLVRQASTTLESLLLGRLYANRFLVSNLSTDLERAQLELSRIDTAGLKSAVAENISANNNALVTQFEQYYQQYNVILSEVSQVIYQRNSIIDNTLNVVGPNFEVLLEDVKISVKADLEALGTVAQSSTQNTVLLVAAFGLLSIILGSIAAIVLPKLIRKPIGGEPKDISLITTTISKGDLTQTFENADSATGIYKAIINMNSNLQRLIKDIVVAVGSIAQSANNSADVAKMTSDAASEQKERTALLATAITEMLYSNKEVVHLSEQSEQKAQDAQTQINDGKVIVQKTADSIGLLANQMNNAIEMVKSLEQRSQEIGSVIEVINNISDQTNLLALNAAIEAARAGELGRGFAVVADEVRTLAQRTQSSTSEIQSTIGSLQSGITSVVKSMEDCGTETQETVKQSDATNDLLDLMLSSITAITHMNSQVKEAAQEQSNVMADLNQNVTAIADSSDLTATAANNTSQAAQEMSTLSEGLRRSIIGFKVE
ncbi:methyl-accepting chemotaxis protein [Glaciecola sp. SC05]|uniref:methyl-accepting chemotaxis protein n=1 Tax=Glaciecola sp. SC05 TaxID=1987355 RepID=UPI0035285CF8